MAEEASPVPSKTYTGGCHCKENRFEVELSPPIDQQHTVIRCNCSICELNGYLLAFTEPDKIKWTKGGPGEKLTAYNFNTGKITHQFCPICGTSISVFGTINGVTKTGINVRGIDGQSLDNLHIYNYDGSSS